MLFEREGRSIRLTPEGETLMRHVERGFGELHLGLSSVAARKPQLLKLHCAPSFAAQWLVPRLRKLLAECAGLELRLATGTDYTKFLADEFDADIVYGVPATDYYGTMKQQGLIVLPLGTEVVTPLCAPSLAPEIRCPSDLLKQTLIESDNKKVRWPAWFAANGLVAPLPNGPRFDRSFMSLSAAADEIGVALEFDASCRARDRIRPPRAPPSGNQRGRCLHGALACLPAIKAVRAIDGDIHKLAHEAARPRHQSRYPR